MLAIVLWLMSWPLQASSAAFWACHIIRDQLTGGYSIKLQLSLRHPDDFCYSRPRQPQPDSGTLLLEHTGVRRKQVQNPRPRNQR